MLVEVLDEARDGGELAFADFAGFHFLFSLAEDGFDARELFTLKEKGRE